VERETGFEPATLSLEGWRNTLTSIYPNSIKWLKY